MGRKRAEMAAKESKILIGICIAVVILILVLIGYVIITVFTEDGSNSMESSLSAVSSKELYENSSVTDSKNSNKSKVNSVANTGENKLNPEYERLLLVNGEKPLPAEYDYTGNLMTVDEKYLCGLRNQLDKDIWPYTKAMIEAAWKDGVELYILSPYRSYSVQETLYENEVKEWMATGLDRAAAELKAATAVARPGTSEHHTGLAVDFNKVEDSFENTEAYRWLEKNAENYGFIMRYSAEKQPITGVIYESWHWRFVGINHARKINELGMCLEEYIEYLGNTAAQTRS